MAAPSSAPAPVSLPSGAVPLRLHGYIPGLDILRGIAGGAVVIFHAFANSGYTGNTGSAAFIVVRLAGLGKLGVYLFFVLSGFLITSILLKERERPRYYRNFYAGAPCVFFRHTCFCFLF